MIVSSFSRTTATATRTAKSSRFYEQNNNLKHVHDAFLVHFFTVTSQDYKFLFLPLNFVAVSKNSILGKFTYI